MMFADLGCGFILIISVLALHPLVQAGCDYNCQHMPLYKCDLSDCTGALNLGGKQLSGTIPNSVGHFGGLNSNPGLTQLFLNFNQLWGTIPSSLGSITGLTTLELDSNQLSGTIPKSLAWPGGGLAHLRLDHNRLLNGVVPVLWCEISMGTCDMSWTSLCLPVDCSKSAWCGLFHETDGGWSAWSECTHSFDSGTRGTRSRACTQPAPQCGGKRCVGSIGESCVSQPTPGKTETTTAPTTTTNGTNEGNVPPTPTSNPNTPPNLPAVVIAVVITVVVGVVVIVLILAGVRIYLKQKAVTATTSGHASDVHLALIGTSDPQRRRVDGAVSELQGDLDHLVQALQASDFLLGDADIRLGPMLGGGAAGQVYAGFLACDFGAEANVALKQSFQGMMQQKTTEILHEVGILLKLKHRNVVQLYGLWTRDDPELGETRLYMVMELCEGGSLQRRIARGNIALAQKLQWACDIGDGVHYLHSRKPCVVHRDLKPANVVLTRGGRAKLVDFGLSRVLTSSNGPLTGMVGTVVFMAPELMGDSGKDDGAAVTTTTGPLGAVDIYSFAIMLCQLWTDRDPYDGLPVHQVLAAVSLHNKRPSLELRHTVEPAGDGGTDPRLALHDTMSELIERMWVVDPADRPTAVSVSKRLHYMRTSANGEEGEGGAAVVE